MPSGMDQQSAGSGSGGAPDGAKPESSSTAARIEQSVGRSGSDPAAPAGARPAGDAKPSGDGPDGANRAATRKTKEF